MKSSALYYVSIATILLCRPAATQSIPVAKTIDTTKCSVVAILRVDSSGTAWVSASGVLIHPQVVLTAGHVNFASASYWSPGCWKQGFVSLRNNAYAPADRIPFDWLQDVEAHPDAADFRKSLSDTTGRTNPSMFVDVGLLFLPYAVNDRPLACLPRPAALDGRTADDLLVGVGYGYHKTYDSTFVPKLVDGLRRQWRLHTLECVNDLWMSTGCDTVTNLPFMSMYDSGAPLFLGDNVVIGIWSRWDKASKPCPYSSCAVRIDNPRVLEWIKDRIKNRLNISLN